MNLTAVERIANAVLYEGYLLYPYRPSALKNQKRFHFGVLRPRTYCKRTGDGQWMSRVEFLLEGASETTVTCAVRFLQIGERDGRQEGYAREVEFHFRAIFELVSTPACRAFHFIGGPEGARFGALSGLAELSAKTVGKDLYQLSLATRNESEEPEESGGGANWLDSFVSLHAVLRTEGGSFVSLLDPPEALRFAAAGCRNDSAWPVLAGKPGSHDTMLASPIILYDYPEIAPESPGDFFDATEIDEILMLRILTLTDAEKQEMRAGDARGRQILERAESLGPAELAKLHGVWRELAQTRNEVL